MRFIASMLAFGLLSFAVAAQDHQESQDPHAGHEGRAESATQNMSPKEMSPNNLEQSARETIYTCPMHPQIRQPGPGRCPICGMELVPAASESGDSTNASSITISPASRRLAGIKTDLTERKSVSKKIKAVGNITFDESRLATIPAYVDGRIEDLYADYTGVAVKKGDHLAVLYSPALFGAQTEFLQSRKTLGSLSGSTLEGIRGTQYELFENAKTKLAELGMTKEQISSIERSGKAKSRLEIFAPIGGTVIEKPTARGQYVKAGQTLFRIADLSSVWLVLELFPEDAAYVHFGQKVTARVRSVPGKVFDGRVAFINPVVNPSTRTVGVRVEVVNETGELRPGDYAEAELSLPISPKGTPGNIYDPELAGKYISPMHPQIISDKPGKCPICGMELVPVEKYGFSAAKIQGEEVVVVPRDAVLQIGRTAVVFVEDKENVFTIREVRTGPAVGREIVILEGLDEFENIAVDGVFLLDSQMQLSGKTSLIDISAGKGAQ